MPFDPKQLNKFFKRFIHHKTTLIGSKRYAVIVLIIIVQQKSGLYKKHK
jgi:hypothetical protein